MSRKSIAFLRAINVGGHTVKMEQLRALFAALKLANVETFIASGNVIFDTPSGSIAALEQRIERHLEKSLGYKVATMIRSASEVGAVAAYEPFAASEFAESKSSLYITFLKDAPTREAARALMAKKTPVDALHVHGREVYWLVRGNLMDSRLSGASMEKILSTTGTMRNATTVRKLAAKYAA